MTHGDKISKSKRNTSINIDLFKKWSKDMSYVLGVLAADGCISITNKRYDIKLGVWEKDKKWLESIRNILGKTLKIRKHKNTNCLDLCFGCKEMVNDLIKLGITPRKSQTLMFPKIPNKYLWDFIRGYFDGDGFVIISKRKEIRIGFTSSKYFIKQLQDIVQKEINHNITFYLLNNKKIKHKNTACCETSGYYAIKVAKRLYQNNGLKLERKYQKYLEAKKLFQEKVKLRKNKSKGNNQYTVVKDWGKI